MMPSKDDQPTETSFIQLKDSQAQLHFSKRRILGVRHTAKKKHMCLYILHIHKLYIYVCIHHRL